MLWSLRYGLIEVLSIPGILGNYWARRFFVLDAVVHCRTVNRISHSGGPEATSISSSICNKIIYRFSMFSRMPKAPLINIADLDRCTHPWLAQMNGRKAELTYTGDEVILHNHTLLAFPHCGLREPATCSYITSQRQDLTILTWIMKRQTWNMCHWAS